MQTKTVSLPQRLDNSCRVRLIDFVDETGSLDLTWHECKIPRELTMRQLASCPPDVRPDFVGRFDRIDQMTSMITITAATTIDLDESIQNE